MKKLAISLAIISALGLSGCNDESLKDIENEAIVNGTQVIPAARVVFNPSDGELSIPNDLLFQGTLDGTLNVPVADATDFSDPSVAISALDGWSVSNPFVLAIDFPTKKDANGDDVHQTTLDAASVFSPESVFVYEAIMGGGADECAEVPRGLACKVVNKLTFGVDYVAKAVGNSIAVVPLKPLKGKTSYIVALSNNIKDSAGASVAGSSTYELVKQDINTLPLETASQLAVQGLINSFENAIAAAGGDKASLIYTMAMTTQSTTDVLYTTKSLMAANLAQGVYPTIGVQDTGASVADILAGNIPDHLVTLYSSANFMQGTITLPYYLGVPTMANPMAPVNEWWKSLCDSGVMLSGMAAADPTSIPAAPVSQSDGMCMAISQAQGLASPGLRDLGIDTERNLTQYSPVVAPKAASDFPHIPDAGKLTVQMTTPDLAIANAVRTAKGLPELNNPENGWPVVILQHGITSKKEDMLALTGLLSVYGFATVAIDHPLHGSRGFDLNGDGIDEINASTVSATHYMNLASLLTARDNLRQSTLDLLGLRFGLNFLGGVDVTGAPIKVDASEVHFLGHSLGAITGINFMALTNTPLNEQVDGFFKVATNSQAMPGLMVANLLLESSAFGDTIKSSLTYKSSPEFQGFVASIYPDVTPSADDIEAAYVLFYSNLNVEQQASLNATFSQFAFAAQTVLDAGDPVSYAGILAATQTPTHVIEVVGDGLDNLSDQVIPNTVTTSTMAGTEGAIGVMNLSGVSQTVTDAENTVSGAVRYLYGHHGSILTPAPREEAQDVTLNGRATEEMQAQVANFFDSMGHSITVQDAGVVQQ